jgi:hypothetical protein
MGCDDKSKRGTLKTTSRGKRHGATCDDDDNNNTTTTARLDDGVRSVDTMYGDAGLRYLLYQSLPSILAHLLDFFATPARAHGPRIAVIVLLLLLLHLDIRAIAGYYDGAAGFPAP